jgi:hypothetical protein
LPRDSRWRSVSAPIDELEEWAQIAKRDDPRLPDPFSALDSIRSIVKLYKKQRLRDSGTVRGTDSQPAPDRTVPPEKLPDTAESGETYDVEAHSRKLELLDKQAKLEAAKANTAYWQARSKGRVILKGETTRVRDLPESWSQRSLCPKCGVPVHPDLTCDEARIAVRALGGFVEH